MEELTTLEQHLLNSIIGIRTRKGFYVSVGKLPRDTPTYALYDEVMMLVRTYHTPERVSTGLRRLYKAGLITYGTDDNNKTYFKIAKKNETK